MELMKSNIIQQQQVPQIPQAAPASADNNEAAGKPSATSEPAPKKKALELLKELKLADRMDRTEDNIEKITVRMKQNEAQQAARFARLEQALQSQTDSMQENIAAAVQQSVAAAVQQSVAAAVCSSSRATEHGGSITTTQRRAKHEQPNMDRSTTSTVKVWQWNCHGFASKKAVLQQHIRPSTRKPDIILIQETLVEETRLPGYKAYASPPSRVANGKGRGVCTLVRKGLKYEEREGLKKSLIEHTMTEVITGQKRKQCTFIMNIYSSPSHRRQIFKALLHKACRTAGRDDNLIKCGDFNAHNQPWGYTTNNAKGNSLLTDATEEGFTLIKDPTYPTRTGNSTCRDTTPDLTFVRISQGGRTPSWINTGHNLGSDHLMIEVTIPLKGKSHEKRIHKLRDWDLYRTPLPGEEEEIQDVDEWSNKIMEHVTAATKETETDVEIVKMDSHLAHMLEAKTSSWRQRHAGGKTWAMLRHLLDETKTKSHQRDSLNKTLNKASRELGKGEMRKRINDKHQRQEETHPDYWSTVNEKLDRDIETWEVRTAVHELNCRSAAGPDRVTNKALKHINEAAIASLTALFNKCWRACKLPKN
ncbi:uncharacterized protein LOC144158997 [Haemaphysalis longicornis]